MRDSIPTRNIAGTLSLYDFDGGHKIKSIRMHRKNNSFHINKTMMRLDLAQPLASVKKHRSP